MSVKSESKKGRRQFLLTASLAGAALRPESAAAAPMTASGAPATYVMDDTSAVGETESGKVLGYIRNEIRIFKGIPYAEIHAPQGRWMRASTAKPWTGKRESRATGPTCPTGRPPREDAARDEVLFHNTGPLPNRQGEDCLRINIWTPGLDNKKRNVMFWCHGGGFTGGSSLGSTAYEFANLAEHGDVVIVSSNHRLSCLGFLDLTAYGERFADSANLGMLDMVDALKWVQRNISNFGGDPGKVTIFGHSGGGAKVATLLEMPEAKGLFHRAIMQSPGPLPLSTPEESVIRTAAFLKLVDVAPSNLDALYKISADNLATAGGIITGAATIARAKFAARRTPANTNWWKPTVDGRTILAEPTKPNAPSNVPLIVGTALHEAFPATGHPEYDTMSEQKAREILHEHVGPTSDQVYDIYKGIFPQANPYEISAMARATEHTRRYCVRMAESRAAFNAAPSYLYWFQWRAKILGGRPKCHHELEIPLVFLHSDDLPQITGGTADARALGMKMADTWLQFARTGDPNNKAIPRWAPAESKKGTAMVFDNQCRIDPGSDAAAIDLIFKSWQSDL